MDPLSGDGPAPGTPSRPERMLSALASMALAAMGVLVALVVLSRVLGVTLVPDSVLLVRELMVLVILLPLATITVLREHIAVTVFTSAFGPRVQRLLAVLGHLVGLVFASALFMAGMRLLSRSYASGEYYYGVLNIPQWVGHGLFVLGVGVFGIRLLVMLTRDIAACAR